MQSVLAAKTHTSTPAPGIALTIWRLLCCRGRRRPGILTGIVFPIRVTDLTGRGGPELLTNMLRHWKHLPTGVSVKSVRDKQACITDGVKGDKAIIEVEYDGQVDLPMHYFVKFNLQAITSLPVRLLSEASEVCRCEALFYHRLASMVSIPTPRCYFTDFNDVTGEFVLLSELVCFGEGGLLPAKHRVRDPTTLEEQRLFIVAGARLNSQFWGKDHPALAGMPRFDETHRRLWVLIQLLAKRGLHFTTRKTLGGKKINETFMTWEPPPELVGREQELINDMPEILQSLCEDSEMMAFGHNDYTTDNAFFRRDGEELKLGLLDWQQSCLNNVGQEWAWNLHFLRPEFLNEHEAHFVDLILKTYEEQGIQVSRDRFLDAYVLGTVQMYVFGGGSLHVLLGDLHRRGLYASLVPEDPRCGSKDLDLRTREKLVGAEMTRRTFTNVCGIMRRHGFADAWRRWKCRREESHRIRPGVAVSVPSAAPGRATVVPASTRRRHVAVE